MKIAIIDTVEASFRRHLFPLLKPFYKAASFSDAQRQAQYKISEKDINFVETSSEAKVLILPMSWNFYLKHNKMDDALQLVQESAKSGKVWTFTTGDFGIKLPKMENVFVFRESGDRRKAPATHLGIPSFIEDPLVKQYQTTTITVQPYTEKPVVGFCGQANTSKIQGAKELLTTAKRNAASVMGIRKEESQQWVATSLLRAKLLSRLQTSEKVISHFILRKKYRAGVKTEEDRIKTTQEFYDNIRDSQYVLCVRGVGNFSVRLYETLAMGRIPIFVDTYGLLPLASSIDWKKHTVWIAYEERHRIAEKVASFHKNQTLESFEALQKSNRQLWQEQLTLGGYFKTYWDE